MKKEIAKQAAASFQETALVEDGATDVPGAEAFTGLGRSTLYKLMETGKLPFIKIGKSRRIPRKALVDLLASGLVSQGS